MTEKRGMQEWARALTDEEMLTREKSWASARGLTVEELNRIYIDRISYSEYLKKLVGDIITMSDNVENIND